MSEGEFAKHGISLGGRPSHGVLDPGADVSRPVGARAGATPRAATRRSSATWWWTCHRRASCTGRSCGRRPTRTRSRSTRSCACTTSRSASPTWPTRPGTWSGCSRRWSATGRSPVSHCDDHVLAVLQRTLRAGNWTATVAVHDGATIVAVWPGFRDRALGVAFDVGSTTVAGPAVRPGERERAGGGRRDEPPDPVRRGPDEPRVLRDDEPGIRDPAHRRGAIVRRRADRRSLRAGGRGPDRHPGAHRGRQPDHASPVPGPGSDRAGRGAVRAGDRRRRAPPRDGPEPPHPPGRARLPAAVHRRTRRRGHRGRDPVRGAVPTGDRQPDRRRRDERGDRPGQPRPDAGRVEPHRSGVRRRADQLRSAGGAGRDRTRPHRRADARAALHRDRGRSLVRRTGVRRVEGHRGVRLGDHRGDRGDVPGRHPDHRWGHRRRAGGPDAAGRPRRAHVLLRAARRRRRAWSSRRTTCGRSSWRRRRSTPGAGS